MWRTGKNTFCAVTFMVVIAVWLLVSLQASRTPTKKLQQPGIVEESNFGRLATQPATQGAPEISRLLLVAEGDEKLLA